MYCLHDLDVNVELHLLAELAEPRDDEVLAYLNLHNNEDLKQNSVERQYWLVTIAKLKSFLSESVDKIQVK